MAKADHGKNRGVWWLVALVVAAVALWRFGATPSAPSPAPPASATAAPPSPAPTGRRPRFGGRGRQPLQLGAAEPVASEGIGALEGAVVSRGDARPVARATLSFSSGTLHTVTSDGEGHFHFQPPAEGVYELALVTAPGFLPFAPEWGHSPLTFVARRGAGLRGARLELTPAIDYTAVVVSPAGDPVPGAEVLVLGGAEEGTNLAGGSPIVRTDDAGEAIVQCPDGAVLQAAHPDFGPGRARLDFAAQVSHRVTIELSRAGTSPFSAHLQGTVVDGRGQPIGDALVVAHHEPDEPARAPPSPDVRTVTDGDGRFVLEGLVEGAHHIVATAPGYAPATVRRRAPHDEITLELARGARLTGDVTDATTGKPVTSFAVVVLERLGPLRKRVVTVEPTFDVEGQYEVPALPSGTFLVTVQARGYAETKERRIQVADQDLEASFQLSRGGTIRGIVRNSETQSPLAGARVSMEGLLGSGDGSLLVASSALTGSDGLFELGGINPGAQSVMAAAARHHGRLVGVQIAEGATTDVAIELTPTEEGEAPRIELAGIGAILSARDERLVIGGLVDGGGAAEVGLRAGDAIVAVEGVPVTSLGFDGAIRKIRGPADTTVTLTVIRAEAEEPELLEVPRRKIRS